MGIGDKMHAEQMARPRFYTIFKKTPKVLYSKQAKTKIKEVISINFPKYLYKTKTFKYVYVKFTT